jgi:hypothetical protein
LHGGGIMGTQVALERDTNVTDDDVAHVFEVVTKNRTLPELIVARISVSDRCTTYAILSTDDRALCEGSVRRS